MWIFCPQMTLHHIPGCGFFVHNSQIGVKRENHFLGHFVLRENGRQIGFLSDQLLMHYSIVYKSTLMLWEIHIMNLLIAGFIFALVSSQVRHLSTYLSNQCRQFGDQLCHQLCHEFLGNGFCGRHHKRIWNVSGTATNADESTARIYETSKSSNGRSNTQ